MAEVRAWLERLGENRARAYRILVYERIKALLVEQLFHGLLTCPLYRDADVPLSMGPFSDLVGQHNWLRCHAWEIHFKVTLGITASAALFLRSATPPACSESCLEVQLLGAVATGYAELPAYWVEATGDDQRYWRDNEEEDEDLANDEDDED